MVRGRVKKEEQIAFIAEEHFSSLRTRNNFARLIDLYAQVP